MSPRPETGAARPRSAANLPGLPNPPQAAPGTVPAVRRRPLLLREPAFASSTQPIANLTGAVLGAALIGLLGLPGLVTLNAASYAIPVVALAVARFRPRPVAPPVPAGPPGAGTPPAAPDTRTGAWRLLATMPVVRAVLCCFAVANFFTAPVLLVIPLYTRSVLVGSSATMATLEAAIWFGLLAGAFTGGMLRVGTLTVTRLGAASVALNALALGLPGLIPSYYGYLATLALGGWCVGVVNVRFIAFFQQVVPPEMKGGFFATMQGLISIAYPVSCLAFGALGNVVTPRVLCLAQAGGLLVVAAVLAMLRSRPGQPPRSA